MKNLGRLKEMGFPRGWTVCAELGQKAVGTTVLRLVAAPALSHPATASSKAPESFPNLYKVEQMSMSDLKAATATLRRYGWQLHAAQDAVSAGLPPQQRNLLAQTLHCTVGGLGWGAIESTSNT